MPTERIPLDFTSNSNIADFENNVTIINGIIHNNSLYPIGDFEHLAQLQKIEEQGVNEIYAIVPIANKTKLINQYVNEYYIIYAIIAKYGIYCYNYNVRTNKLVAEGDKGDFPTVLLWKDIKLTTKKGNLTFAEYTTKLNPQSYQICYQSIATENFEAEMQILLLDGNRMPWCFSISIFGSSSWNIDYLYKDWYESSRRHHPLPEILLMTKLSNNAVLYSQDSQQIYMTDSDTGLKEIIGTGGGVEIIKNANNNENWWDPTPTKISDKAVCLASSNDALFIGTEKNIIKSKFDGSKALENDKTFNYEANCGFGDSLKVYRSLLFVVTQNEQLLFINNKGEINNITHPRLPNILEFNQYTKEESETLEFYSPISIKRINILGKEFFVINKYLLLDLELNAIHYCIFKNPTTKIPDTELIKYNAPRYFNVIDPLSNLIAIDDLLLLNKKQIEAEKDPNKTYEEVGDTVLAFPPIMSEGSKNILAGIELLMVDSEKTLRQVDIGLRIIIDDTETGNQFYLDPDEFFEYQIFEEYGNAGYYIWRCNMPFKSFQLFLRIPIKYNMIIKEILYNVEK